MENNIDSKVNIEFHHCELPNIDLWENDELDYNPFDISHLQTYYPMLEIFDNYPKDVSNTTIKTHYKIHNNLEVTDYQEPDIQQPKSIFFKYGPLLDPCHFLIGKYKNSTIELPKLNRNLNVY